jgi:hypothetical protein
MGADTVAARSFKERNESHGWLGVRFQSQLRGQPSQIIVHVRLLDEANVDQQEALGVIGVNLLHGTFYCRQPEKLISSLQKNLPPGGIDVIPSEVKRSRGAPRKCRQVAQRDVSTSLDMTVLVTFR